MLRVFVFVTIGRRPTLSLPHTQDFSEVYADDPFDIIIDCLPGE
jgi:hypothetical protein